MATAGRGGISASLILRATPQAACSACAGGKRRPREGAPNPQKLGTLNDTRYGGGIASPPPVLRGKKPPISPRPKAGACRYRCLLCQPSRAHIAAAGGLYPVHSACPATKSGRKRHIRLIETAIRSTRFANPADAHTAAAAGGLCATLLLCWRWLPTPMHSTELQFRSMSAAMQYHTSCPAQCL